MNESNRQSLILLTSPHCACRSKNFFKSTTPEQSRSSIWKYTLILIEFPCNLTSTELNRVKWEIFCVMHLDAAQCSKSSGCTRESTDVWGGCIFVEQARVWASILVCNASTAKFEQTHLVYFPFKLRYPFVDSYKISVIRTGIKLRATVHTQSFQTTESSYTLSVQKHQNYTISIFLFTIEINIKR